MHKIDFIEPDSEEWRGWRDVCAVATRDLINSVRGGAGPKIDDKLYKAQQGVYLSLDGPFRGKCGYCEDIIISDQYGDIEHFRPKGGVQEEDWSKVAREIDGNNVEHPGYYWLAYDWKNLLLACVSCNRPSRGKLFGKWNRFPVVGFRAWQPGEEIQETPLLLNPCIDNPREHIVFDSLDGRLVGISDRGWTTINILGLNDRHLPERRRKAYRDFVRHFRAVLAQSGDWAQELIALRDDPLADFPTAVSRADQDMRNEYIEGLQRH